VRSRLQLHFLFLISQRHIINIQCFLESESRIWPWYRMPYDDFQSSVKKVPVRRTVKKALLIQGGHKPGKTWNTRGILWTWKTHGILGILCNLREKL